MENTEKFIGKSDVYEKYRPSYPQAFIDYLYNEIGMKKESVVADIGAGTGIFSRLLLERGSNVICVEPNDEMRAVSQQTLQDYSQCEISNGSAEETLLPNKSVDFITVAQAFHWFDRKKFQQESQRVLKDKGKVILVWNNKNASADMIQAYEEINKKLCPYFKGFSGGSTGEIEAILSFFKDEKCETREFEHHLSFTLEEFIGNTLSASYAPREGDSNYEIYIEAITELFYLYSKDGRLKMPYLTRSYIGEV